MEKKDILSLVVPVYYEEDCILQFLKETSEVLNQQDIEYEYIFVDDGSKDKTVDIIKAEAQKNARIKLVELSYNHGKKGAVTAGINYATGDYLLYMDPDLQDPPLEIPNFLQEIRRGYDVVYGIRKEKVDTFVNKIYSTIFWGTLRKFTGLDIPKGLAVMRIFNRRFADTFLQYKEQNRFIEGLFFHIGLNRSTLHIEQRERFAGKTKYNFKKKMQLAFDAIFDFSEIPLKMAVRFGTLLILLGLLAVIVLVFSKIFIVDFQAGWPSLITAIMLGTGLQLFLWV
ncbi:glycosyltransferase family 2 protein [Flavisolibacter tropicus]|uniref:glycosyltransferase family 2 protein n=1 Tax=Flavisolibacter tropicus TaxID=1492898 RepID=UPI0009EDB234|nr:glycosyltransferase family 2 protein [Flavisolibacter tropicus]